MANEVDIIINAIDKASDEIRAVNNSLGDIQGTTKQASFSMTELNSAVDLVRQGMEAAKQVYAATAGELINYANEVRALQQVSGQSAEDSSRLIQLVDDYKISLQDLMATQRELNKDGKVMNAEFLAATADNYAAATTQAEKNKVAQDALGRSWRTYVELLQQGGDAIRENAASISENNILSQEMVDMARQQEMAIDGLEDAFAGIVSIMTQQAMPAIVGVTEFLKDGAEGWAEYFADRGNYLEQEAKTAEVLKEQGLTMSRRAAQYTGLKVATQEQIDLARQEAAARINQANAMKETESVVSEYTQTTEELAEAEKAAAEAVKAQTQEYLGIISLMGELQSSTDSYNQKQADLTKQMAENRAEAEALYPWQSEELAKLNEQYAGMQEQYAANSAAFVEASNAKIAQMLLEKDSVDGLTQAEFERNVKLQESLGLLDAKTAELAIRQNELTSALANTTLSADKLKQAIDLLPSGKSIDVIMNIIGANFGSQQGNTPSSAEEAQRWAQNNQRATGGAASGWTMVGEKGPELVDLPGGSNVASAGSTRELMQGAQSQPAFDMYAFASVISSAIGNELDRRGIGV